MTKRTPRDQNPGKLTGVDHLFGRDLRRNGWFVDENLSSGGRRRRPCGAMIGRRIRVRTRP